MAEGEGAVVRHQGRAGVSPRGAVAHEEGARGTDDEQDGEAREGLPAGACSASLRTRAALVQALAAVLSAFAAGPR